MNDSAFHAAVLLRNRLFAQQSLPTEQGLARLFGRLPSFYLPTTE